MKEMGKIAFVHVAFHVFWAVDPLETFVRDRDDRRATPLILEEAPQRLAAINRMLLVLITSVDEVVQGKQIKLHFRGIRTCHDGTFSVEGWCDRQMKAGYLTLTPALT